MNLSLVIAANAVSKTRLHHPQTKAHVGTLIIAGPDHPETKAWKREINDRRQQKDYIPDPEGELIEGLTRRTVGWEDVKDTGTKDDVPFGKEAMPAIYAQEWARNQVINDLGDEGFFFRE